MKSIDKPCANYEKEEHIMARPLADYVKLPGLEEYKEWFKDFADLKREDGILQVTWKTLDGPMHHSGMSHRAIPQLVRVLSLDTENEIIIFTHIGDNWMIESDANGWETYSQLPKQRFQHQYFDDTNLITEMLHTGVQLTKKIREGRQTPSLPVFCWAMSPAFSGRKPPSAGPGAAPGGDRPPGSGPDRKSVV